MGLLDTITDLANTTMTVTRRTAGAYDASGIYVDGSVQSTFTITVVVEPANGIARVVGGRDQQDDEQGEKVFDVRAVWSATELFTRKPGFDADIVNFDGNNWKVSRAEKWDLGGQVHWKLAVSRLVSGAA
jgi:hypothetical protein